MKVVRNPLQILEEVGALLTAGPRLPQLVEELRSCPALAGAQPSRVVEIIRARLAVHGVPTEAAEQFVAQYQSK
jgi:hypothetical protein